MSVAAGAADSIAAISAAAKGAAAWNSGIAYVDARVPVGTEPQPKSGWLPTASMYALDVAHSMKSCAASELGEPVGTAIAQAQSQFAPTGLPAFGDCA